MKKINKILFFLLVNGVILAETNDLKYLGTKQPYIYKEITVKTPEGYVPFYINHISRHGSRHLSSSKYAKQHHGLLRKILSP